MIIRLMDDNRAPAPPPPLISPPLFIVLMGFTTSGALSVTETLLIDECRCGGTGGPALDDTTEIYNDNERD